MKALLSLLLLFSIKLSAQDTIVKNDGKVIPCKITMINESSIFYQVKKIGESIALSEVKSYALHSADVVRPGQEEVKKESPVLKPKEKPAPTFINTAGQELIIAKKHMYGGILLGLGGSAIATVGAANESVGVGIVGGIVALAGIALGVESISHIGKAGEILDSKMVLAPTPTGISIAFKF